MRQEYRITSWGPSRQRRTHSTLTFSGTTIEACDEKALAHFEKISNGLINAWSGMEIFRIDSPAVAEKTTFLTKNGRQEFYSG